MNKKAMQKKEKYSIPLIEVEERMLYELLCDSPVEGGLEDIGYEDWVG